MDTAARLRRLVAKAERGLLKRLMLDDVDALREAADLLDAQAEKLAQAERSRNQLAVDWQNRALTEQRGREAAERRLAQAEQALAFYAEQRNYRQASGIVCTKHGSAACAMEHRDAFDQIGPGARARAALAARPAADK